MGIMMGCGRYAGRVSGTLRGQRQGVGLDASANVKATVASQSVFDDMED